MVRAIIGAAIVGVVAPALGVFMVLRRLSLIADTLSHVALACVAIGVLTRTYPPYVALGGTSAAAVAIEQLRARKLLPGDAALAVFLYGALALAVVIFSLARGLNSSLFAYLFGSVLTVTTQELWLASAVGAVAMLFVWVFFSELGQTSFDSDLARINGVRVNLVTTLLAAVTGAAITISMQMVGVLLVGAMLVVPSLIALRLASGLKRTALVASATGLAIAVIGVAVAFYANLAPGGAVVLTGIAMLFVVEVAHMVCARLRRNAVAVSGHQHRTRHPAADVQAQLRLPVDPAPNGEDASQVSRRTGGPTRFR